VEEGHVEIVLTGIFLGAFGQETALHRRQAGRGTGVASPLARLVEALCTRVPGLKRLRLSSLEPGDMDESLLETLASYEQVVPHFHLPLQSGSDAVLRRMNRQYTRTDFLEMAAMVQAGFDRPAITTDIITGFPGETAADFEQTMDVAERVGFLDVHAFPYSPRPMTAAARWGHASIDQRVRTERVARIMAWSTGRRSEFIRGFIGEEATVIVERSRGEEASHGRCERYFDVQLDQPASAGDFLRVQITGEAEGRAIGRVLGEAGREEAGTLAAAGPERR
jgi:threonylcarbamoyladenosine tRNA methylthiotransferase MtaB